MSECASCTDIFYDCDDCDDCDDPINEYDHGIESDTCGEEFRSQKACNQHMDALDHYAPLFECETCTKQFRSQNACNQHMDALDHYAPLFECETCTKQFRSQNACNQHMDALDHYALLFECETCTSQFRSESAVNQHMWDLDHWSTYCVPCERSFRSENGLHMHRNSRIHRGTNVLCPFCKTGFVTASGASHHVETGSCPEAPKMNRETVLRIIQAADRKGLIANKKIGWYKEEDVQYIVTNRAFNGNFWECYICHDEFNTSGALTQHLNSPVHKQKVYHCPDRNCPKEFNTLAGLLSHLESESCGYMRFERVQQVQKSLNDVIMGRKQLTSF
ncbi:zinc finger protein [Penicillium sp. IBT 16267x]|nr:zinc finger protein [Penicillium sp. IBT 16267x]